MPIAHVFSLVSNTIYNINWSEKQGIANLRISRQEENSHVIDIDSWLKFILVITKSQNGDDHDRYNRVTESARHINNLLKKENIFLFPIKYVNDIV